MIENVIVRMFDSLRINIIETYNTKYHCTNLFSSEKSATLQNKTIH